MKKTNRKTNNSCFIQFSEKTPIKKEKKFGGKIICFWDENYELVALDVKSKKDIPNHIYDLIMYWENHINTYDELESKHYQLSYFLKSYSFFSVENLLSIIGLFRQ